MSHFTVLVVGDDVKSALAPFHEFECTGVDDQYVVDVDITEEVRQEHTERSEPSSLLDFAKYWYGVAALNPGDSRDYEVRHKYGFAEVDANGELLRVVRRTNPNKKWDWWAVGGRWKDRLILRDGRRANSATKRDVDFEAMRRDSVARAMPHYERFHRILAGRPLFESWASVRNRMPNIEGAREFYNTQPLLRELTEANAFSPFEDPIEEYGMTRDAYIERARARGVSFFAFLRNGVWSERGEMGWFGVTTNEKDDWEQRCAALIETVGADERITVVDCHI